MNSLQIRRALRSNRQTNKVFRDVIAANELPENDEQRGLYVVNTDESHLPGEHWTAIHFAGDNIVYFDSYGRPPHPTIMDWLDNKAPGKNVYYFQKRIQGLLKTCGHYCIYFALCLVDRSKTLNIFSDHLISNDVQVIRVTKKYFPL